MCIGPIYNFAMLNRAGGAREGPQRAPPGAPKRGGCPGDRAFGDVGAGGEVGPGWGGRWGALLVRA